MNRQRSAINETSNKKKHSRGGGGTIEFKDNKKGCSQDDVLKSARAFLLFIMIYDIIFIYVALRR